jgi:hypothetical protein
MDNLPTINPRREALAREARVLIEKKQDTTNAERRKECTQQIAKLHTQIAKMDKESR